MSDPVHERRVVICDRDGQALGTAGLLEAHRGDGILHRAFSIFVFRNGGDELLLQRRSSRKTFPLLWSNTCCSHPYPAEASICPVAKKRLYEELGFGVDLVEAGSFVYRARDVDSQLTEYEHDSVLIGWAEGDIPMKPDRQEVADWRWVSVGDLSAELASRGGEFSPWFPDALQIALETVQRRG